MGGVVSEDGIDITVEAYSGYRVNERPVRFLLEGEWLGVDRVLDRWYGPEADFFKVETGDRRRFLLRWERLPDRWSLLQELPPPDAVPSRD